MWLPLPAVALVSGFIGLVLRQVNLANISMLYLMAVLAVAVAYGRGPAIWTWQKSGRSAANSFILDRSPRIAP